MACSRKEDSERQKGRRSRMKREERREEKKKNADNLELTNCGVNQ